MLKGIENIENETREAASIASGDWIRSLRIKDGDTALIRFVTDKDELIRARFHDVKRMTPKGEFALPVYCTMEDTGLCPNCISGLVPYSTINLWVHVYYILHKTQNPNIQTGSNEGIWSQIKSGKNVMYKEEVNKFMHFRTKYGYQGRYRQMFLDFIKEYDTLCDRDYTWSRTGGTAKNTNYTLMAKKESELDDSIKDAINDLPDLGDVVCGKTRSFSQKKKSDSVPDVIEPISGISDSDTEELF